MAKKHRFFGKKAHFPKKKLSNFSVRPKKFRPKMFSRYILPLKLKRIYNLPPLGCQITKKPRKNEKISKMNIFKSKFNDGAIARFF